ncbi:MAG TPA: hypothetical protein PLC54_04110, partial [Spirochaetales bacterium]|nr:hypothetical protein [Spirochaetales bacterium]
MSFRHPELLWILAALLPYSFTALGFLRSLGRYCKTDVLRLNQPEAERIRRGYLATRAMAAVFGAAFWVLAVLAAADPLAAGERVSTAQGSYQSIAVVLDVSNSMLSSYGGVTRLEAAKK